MMWLLLGCGADVLPPLAAPPVDLVASVEASKVGEGEPVNLTLSLYASEEWTLQLQEPASEGLTVSPTGTDGPTREGSRQRTQLSYTLTGPPGSYVIQPGAARAQGPGDQERELVPPPIFVDIGVDGPTGGELAGAMEPPLPPEPPWALIGAGVFALVALLGGLLWWVMRPKPVPPPEPDDVRAKRLWQESRGAQLSDHDLAVALSGVMRDYLQRRYGWPATTLSSSEILEFLSSHTSADLRGKLTEVLEANDRLKYAREGGGDAFFDELEACFLDVLA
ncbi:MAG: hypothetical protein ACI8RZ_005489, partial [Myxococcota bacterium]